MINLLNTGKTAIFTLMMLATSGIVSVTYAGIATGEEKKIMVAYGAAIPDQYKFET